MDETKEHDEENQQKGDPPQNDDVIKPLDGGWGWVVMLGQMIQIFLTLGIAKSFTLMYLELLDRFRQSDTVTSFTIALQLMTYFAFSFVTGILCNRFEARSIALVGCIFFVGGMITSGYATSIYMVYLGMGVFHGIGMAMRLTPGMVILNQYFKKKKGKAFGFVSIAKGVGGFVMPGFVALLLHHYGWSGTMLMLGGLCMHSFVGALLFRPLKDNFTFRKRTVSIALVERQLSKNPAEERTGNFANSESDQATLMLQADNETEGHHNKKRDDLQTDQMIGNKTAPPQKKKKKTMIHLSLLKDFKFMCFSLGLFFFNCGMTSMTFLAPLGKEKGFTSEEITIGVTVLGVADCVGAIIIGALFDLKSVKRIRYYLFCALFLVNGLGSIGLGLVNSYPVYICSIIIKGLSVNAFWMRVPIMSDLIDDHKVASGLALTSPLNGVGNLIGPIIGGLLTDKFRSYTYVMFFAGACIILASFVMSLGAFSTQSCKMKSQITLDSVDKPVDKADRSNQV